MLDLVPAGLESVYQMAFDSESGTVRTWEQMEHSHDLAEAWHDAPDIVRGFLPTPAALATLSVVTMLTRCHRYASTAPELAASATRLAPALATPTPTPPTVATPPSPRHVVQICDGHWMWLSWQVAGSTHGSCVGHPARHRPLVPRVTRV